MKADVEGARPAAPTPLATAEKKPAAAAASAPTGPTVEAVKKLYADREFEEIKLDGMRKTIAARLSEAKQTIPHFYLRREIRLDALLAFRAQLNKELEARKVKLSVNDFIIKAWALALQQVPDCNAVWAGDCVLRLKPSDVAVAVAIEGGLFTPVLRDADKKSLSALSTEMKDLATRARSRKLAPHEYQGGTFAISNLGMMGIENFDAVINPPHASILAVGAGVAKPVVGASGEIEVATMMSVTLSVDHRVIDGALGAEFLAAIKHNLEHPLAHARLDRKAWSQGYSTIPGSAISWFMLLDGSAQPASPTTRAGTPATVLHGGTSCSTTEPAAIRLQSPTRMLPRTAAPAPISTPSPIFGCRSPSSLPVPPRVTECSIDTLSPTTAVSPITIEWAWSIMIPCPMRAPGWMSTPNTSDVRIWMK